jgi:hypothetical protein
VDNDPKKGTPHRRTHEKIELLLSALPKQYTSYADAYGALELVLHRIADKRPDDVLDALVWLNDDPAETPDA